jgi:hypothetical protein
MKHQTLKSLLLPSNASAEDSNSITESTEQKKVVVVKPSTTEYKERIGRNTAPRLKNVIDYNYLFIL